MWLLFLPILLHNFVIQAFPVFTFNGTSDSSATPSFAFLVSEVDLPDIFILCSSVKQARFDDVGFFSITGKDTREWLRVNLRTKFHEIKFALVWDGKFHWLGKLQNPRLDYWYHVCLRLDLTEGEVEVAVNGKSLQSALDRNVTNIPSKLEMKIGVGYDNQQFQGSVANVKVLKGGNVKNISMTPCKFRQNTILSWNPKNWKVIGSDLTLMNDFEEIFCVPSDHYNLRKPSFNKYEDFMKNFHKMVASPPAPPSCICEILIQIFTVNFATKSKFDKTA